MNLSLSALHRTAAFIDGFEGVLRDELVNVAELRGIFRTDDAIRGVVVLTDPGLASEENQCIYFRVDDRLIRETFAIFEKVQALSAEEHEKMQDQFDLLNAAEASPNELKTRSIVKQRESLQEWILTSDQVKTVTTFLWRIQNVAKHCREEVVSSSKLDSSPQSNSSKWIRSFTVPKNEGECQVAKHYLKEESGISVADFRGLDISDPAPAATSTIIDSSAESSETKGS